MESSICLGISTLVQCLLPFIVVLAGGVWYHISTVNKINHLEDNFRELDDRLNKIEDRLTEAFVRLGTKLDRYIYSKAARVND